MSLLLIDVDGFKEVNDDHGHLMGDHVLMAVADRLSSRLRGADELGRWGGDEFVVVLPHTLLPDATQVAEAMRVEIGSAHLLDGGAVTVTVGVAQYAVGETFDQWLRRADDALYVAKAAGRDRVEPSP